MITPTFDPLSTMSVVANHEQARRAAEIAQKQSDEAACIALIRPFIEAWDKVFEEHKLVVPVYQSCSSHVAECPVYWGDFYGNPCDNPKERHCGYQYRTVHATHHTIFKATAIIPARLNPPVIQVTGKGINSNEGAFIDFDDWYGAFNYCAHRLIARLDEESLAKLNIKREKQQ